MAIGTLVSSALPGVERATAEFGYAHGVQLEGAVPLSLVPKSEIAHLAGLTPVHGLKPKDAWERNIHLADAVVVLCPPRLDSLEVAFIAQACASWSVPFLLTPGLMVKPVVEWLDLVLPGSAGGKLFMAGPAHLTSPRMGARAMRLLDSILTLPVD